MMWALHWIVQIVFNLEVSPKWLWHALVLFLQGLVSVKRRYVTEVEACPIMCAEKMHSFQEKSLGLRRCKIAYFDSNLQVPFEINHPVFGPEQ